MDDLNLTKKGEAYAAASLAADPETLLVPLTNRRAIADSIERLIDMLDTMQPDPDIEPWLGAPELPHSGSQERNWRVPDAEDREDDVDDLEPSLGVIGQWGNGRMEYDLEGGDHGETWPESEPSLGWTEEIDQQRRLETDPKAWVVEDGEPYLGWCENAGRGIREGDPANDGEEDAGEMRECENEHGSDDAEQGGWSDNGWSDNRPRNPSVPADLYPDRFCMIADGACCEPVIMHGPHVLVDKTRQYQPGDFVVIYLDPAIVSKGSHVLRVKRFVQEFPEALVVEMLNPPRVIFVAKAETKAVWFAEPAPADFVPGPRMNDGDLLARRALEMRAH